MITRSRSVRSIEVPARALPHEAGFWAELAVLRVVGASERGWEEIVRRAGLEDDALADALDAMVEGGMLSVRSVEEGTAAFSLTDRGRARLLEVIRAFGERGAP